MPYFSNSNILKFTYANCNSYQANIVHLQVSKRTLVFLNIYATAPTALAWSCYSKVSNCMKTNFLNAYATCLVIK